MRPCPLLQTVRIALRRRGNRWRLGSNCCKDKYAGSHLGDLLLARLGNLWLVEAGNSRLRQPLSTVTWDVLQIRAGSICGSHVDPFPIRSFFSPFIRRSSNDLRTEEINIQSSRLSLVTVFSVASKNKLWDYLCYLK
jgi:hypothetical protein